jgi:type IV fimbrial biogenesis protein FimT
MRTRSHGFSLIELVIVLVIMAILLALGLPSFSNYLRNSRLRAAAQTFLSGVQLARSEAVRRDQQVEFLLTAADPTPDNLSSATSVVTGSNWMIRTADKAVFIEGKFAVDGSAGVSLSTTASSITFDGFGRTNPATSANFNFQSTQANCQIDGGPVRCLRVNVSTLGQARLCDPAVTGTDTRVC